MGPDLLLCELLEFSLCLWNPSKFITVDLVGVFLHSPLWHFMGPFSLGHYILLCQSWEIFLHSSNMSSTTFIFPLLGFLLFRASASESDSMSLSFSFIFSVRCSFFLPSERFPQSNLSFSIWRPINAINPIYHILYLNYCIFTPNISTDSFYVFLFFPS